MGSLYEEAQLDEASEHKSPWQQRRPCKHTTSIPIHFEFENPQNENFGILPNNFLLQEPETVDQNPEEIEFPQNTFVMDNMIQQIQTMTIKKMIMLLKPKTIKLLTLLNIQLLTVKEIMIFRTLIMVG